MAVHLWKHKITYVPVPKAACTALKVFFFEVENGFEWRSYTVNGEARNIHNAGAPAGWGSAYPFAAMPQDKIAEHRRFCVVRDPLARLVSAYRNRVCFHRELDRFGRPDLLSFIDELPRWRALSPSIMHHTRPMVDFLGRAPGYYERVFDISETEELAALVREATGSAVQLGRAQEGGPQVDASAIDEPRRRRLAVLYEEDYAFLARARETASEAA